LLCGLLPVGLDLFSFRSLYMSVNNSAIIWMALWITIVYIGRLFSKYTGFRFKVFDVLELITDTSLNKTNIGSNGNCPKVANFLVV